ncbi:MAG: DUF4032 domain-containing protein [Endomicrobiaceae bacterium]|jgi:hypothetical protein|nr:DUF4032 domain-containing protein [Endomicrobiaceae bacterium]
MASKKKNVLVDFASIEKNFPTYTLKNKGIQAIAIDHIVGSLGRYFDFSESLLPKRYDGSSRYEYMKSLMEQGVNLPPIQVYQILDSYFIIDGHHRVAVAKNEFKAKYIDAEILEVRFPFELSKDKQYSFDTEVTKKFLIKIEEYAFEKSTLLNNDILIRPLKVTELKSYTKLHQEIIDFKQNYNDGELLKRSMMFASYTWYAKRFLPAVMLIEQEKILSKFSNRTYTDLYVWIQKHKYFLSQQAGHDVGFDFTAHDFIEKYKDKKFFDIIPSVFTDIVKNLVK